MKQEYQCASCHSRVDADDETGDQIIRWLLCPFCGKDREMVRMPIPSHEPDAVAGGGGREL